MNIQSEIRRLARSSYWQMLYKNAKAIGVSLFHNKQNLSGLQVHFIYWLQVYNLLYEELSKQEFQNLSEETINDDIRCDAFLYWRQRYITRQINEHKKSERIQNAKLKNPDNGFLLDVDMRG